MRQAAAILVALALTTIEVHATGGTRARYLMGTVCEVAVKGSADASAEVEAAFAEAARIEEMLSTWRESSELSKLNSAAGTTEISPELRLLLVQATSWARRTDGAFNPLIRPLIDAWKTRDDGALPQRAVIEAALTKLRLENVEIGSSHIRLLNGARIEEGGFGKGYAIDRMLAGISASEAMVNFGGQIAVKGSTRVAIADPRDRTREVAELTLRNGSLATSSGSEKTFKVAGREFSHLIDPRSGDALPPRGSVSVISASALEADILSTALYVMGAADGLRWADANGVAALFITGHKIRPTAAFREHVRDLAVVDRKYTLRTD